MLKSVAPEHYYKNFVISWEIAIKLLQALIYFTLNYCTKSTINRPEKLNKN